MGILPLLVAALTLLGTLGIGIVAHELSHAVALHYAGIPYDISWFPAENGAGHFGVGVRSAWAAVTPKQIPSDAPVWGLRLSAIAPLALALPVVLAVAAGVPVALDAGNVVVAAVTVGWLACAIPSPQDFSVFWYADRLVRTSGEFAPVE